VVIALEAVGSWCWWLVESWKLKVGVWPFESFERCLGQFVKLGPHFVAAAVMNYVVAKEVVNAAQGN